MIRFSKEKVKLLHKMIAQETGGSIESGMKACWNLPWKLLFQPLEGRSYIPQKSRKVPDLVII